MMYFPYLRGRQFELLAIRELAENKKLSVKVIPIVEPVRFSSTLKNMLESILKNEFKVALIKNPQVGTYFNDAKDEKIAEKVEALRSLILENDSIIKTVLAAPDTEKHLNWLNEKGIDNSNIISIYTNRDFINYYSELFKETALYNVIPYEPSFRRIRGDRIQINDRFAPLKKERNVDYLLNEDEFFSDDHLYYSGDSYKGFSDYTIVGKDYQESGFAPYAVAIHIVYFAKDMSLRVHHFVSNSNDDMKDPAGKFYEAVSKLHDWNAHMRLNTLGMQLFEELYKTEAYPGLGVIKKLSIMHHLELMGNYLEKV